MVCKLYGSLPVYQQIMEQIEGAVMAGEYLPGDKIPSVRDLATQAKVNPNTVQHALQELERTGLLVTMGTSGRYVTEDRSVLSALRSEKLMELTEQCIKRFALLGVSVPEAVELFQKYMAERMG